MVGYWALVCAAAVLRVHRVSEVPFDKRIARDKGNIVEVVDLRLGQPGPSLDELLDVRIEFTDLAYLEVKVKFRLVR